MISLKLRKGDMVNYRRVQKGDGNRLKNFHNALGKNSQYFFTPHEYDDNTIAKVISRSENDEDRVYIALDSKEEVISYFFLWWYSSAFPVLGIGIADEYQGQGLGKQLMKILIEDGRKKRCKTIELTTMPDNKKAFELYEKVGFKYLGQVDNVSGDGRIVKEWHMYYPLEPGVKPPGRKHEAPV